MTQSERIQDILKVTTKQALCIAFTKDASTRIASPSTAYKGVYNPSISPLHNHCGCVSYTLQQLLGGDLLQANINGVKHIWNLLPNNIEVDLTSDQFGGDGLSPLSKGVIRNSKSTPKLWVDFNEKFELE